jgi:MarR family transcriptional regulator, temperature-dependent positive regulator of motility
MGRGEVKSELAELVQFAKRLQRARQERDAYIPTAVLGEPGWSLLLDLFVAHHQGRVVNSSGACFGAGVPQTTGLRWLDKLDLAGLIVRHPHPRDTRFVMIELSPEGLQRMTAVLGRMQARIGNSDRLWEPSLVATPMLRA